jgi:aspartyl-tRNA(Asn)/glutamyl-tRNA(Gln) amidotransferase subunit A
MTVEVPTIAEAARLIETKALSPVELLDACLGRIRAFDPRLNSFLLVTEELARADARRAESEIAAGKRRGPLHGIPIGHKDIYATRGIRTTGHSRICADHVPTEDATATARLADAGTVLLGKLATHEFAMGGPSFDLPWPPARNPWHTDHFTGGSSSGSGAALAAGLVLGATGTDTGGSIRAPSSFCGVVGIKPTYGLVSRRGIMPLAFTMDHAGPMARTVEDCAILLQAMAGHDAKDPASAEVAVPDYRAALRRELRGTRVGVVRQFHEVANPLDPEMQAAMDAALRLLADLGAEIRDVDMPPLADLDACAMVIVLTEAFAVHAKEFRTRFNDYGRNFRDKAVLGALVSGADYVQALRLRRRLVADMNRAMSAVDVIVTGTTPGPAPKIESVETYGMFKRPWMTMPFNLAGLPALSVCCGFTKTGLPLGMQIAAGAFDDATALAVAHAYEQATSWHKRRPTLQAMAPSRDTARADAP